MTAWVLLGSIGGLERYGYNCGYVWDGSVWTRPPVDTGWVPLTAAAGVTLQGGNARIRNGLLHLQGTASRAAAWTVGLNVATLDPSMRQLITAPTSQMSTFGNGSLAGLNVAAGTGTISLGATGGAASLSLSLTSMSLVG